ncbi:MAG: phage baseplate assembly protein [Ruminococcus sp.]|nr:phage baseplate assembly protein [Ruminococcus sp.]
MWINEYMTALPYGKGTAAAGEIRSASGGSVAVSSTRDYGAVPVIAPAGIAYVPLSGASTVVMDSAGGAVCLGVVAPSKEGLQPGELMLYSAGGASIVLKNSGKVLINGQEVG